MAQRTILITGSTDGLGLACAMELAAAGATVILHGRDQERLDAARDAVAARSGTAGPATYLADLSSLEEVRRLAAQVLSENDRLDVLVNNAGVALPGTERHLSKDGHELTFAVNYLSHFLVTMLLLPLLENSAPARIVNVASVGQRAIDFDDVMLERGYEPIRAYCQSKLAQIMFTLELAERVTSGITVNALHPATLMDTKMVRDTFGTVMTSVEEGRDATMRLVSSRELDGVTGRYFNGKQESTADPQAYDEDARRRLWKLSEDLCGIASQKPQD
jgi:NAD(P)-dependent dehydrogenase (short-subunit alcohol dehydrogenase family)